MFNYLQSEIYRYKKSRSFAIFIAVILIGLAASVMLVLSSPYDDSKFDTFKFLLTYLEMGSILAPMIFASMVYKTRGPQTQIIGYGMSRERHVLGDYLSITYLILKFTVIMLVVCFGLYYGGKAVLPNIFVESNGMMFLQTTILCVIATLAHSAITIGLAYTTGKVSIGNTIYVFLVLFLPQLLSSFVSFNEHIKKIMELYEYTPYPMFNKLISLHWYGYDQVNAVSEFQFAGICALFIVIFLGIGIIFYKRKEI